jgi:hypothetical protein
MLQALSPQKHESVFLIFDVLKSFPINEAPTFFLVANLGAANVYTMTSLETGGILDMLQNTQVNVHFFIVANLGAANVYTMTSLETGGILDMLQNTQAILHFFISNYFKLKTSVLKFHEKLQLHF